MVEFTILKTNGADARDRRIVLLSVLVAVLPLPYFYAIDHIVFSSGQFATIFKLLLMYYDFRTAWLAVAASLVAVLWQNPAPVLKLVDIIGERPLAVVTSSVGLLALGAIFIYHDHPFSMDEYAAVFQAKVFATGHLYAQLPPALIDWLVVPRFNGAFLVASRETGRVIESYWPGFSIVLAPFEFLGMPWLCNATLAGLALFLMHRITLQLTTDRRAAGWAVLFAVGSGAFVANAISYYSMQAHMTANLLFVWLLLRPTNGRVFAAGLVGSLALVLHNPVPHGLFAAPWIVWIALTKDRRRYLPALILGYLPILIGVGAGWLHLRSIITAGSSGFNVISANVDAVFRFPTMAMIDMRTAATVKMTIWAVPGLFVFAALGRLRYGDNACVRLMFQSAVATFIGYLFVVLDQGHGWGYRYFHSAWGVIPILAGCAMAARSTPPVPLMAFAGAAAVLNLVLVVPYQMSQIDSIIAEHSAQIYAPRRPGNDVYFVNDHASFYMGDLIQIDPMLRSTDLLLSSRGPALDAELVRQNWPGALKVGQSFKFQQWYLGPRDVRRQLDGTTAFAIDFREPAVPAAN